jgi:ZIP family zinc transporter
MGEAALWGTLGATALIVAAELAFRVQLSRMVVGLIMAFGVGALISSVSFELIAPAIEEAGDWKVALGLAAGSLVFFLGDRAIGRRSQHNNEADGEEGGDVDEGGDGLGIVLGTVLDGIPESAVIGMSLVGGGSVSTSLLVGIWVSNFPEALGATVSMSESGWAKAKIRLLWWGIIALAAISAALGFVIVESSSLASGVLIEAFAAGALLSMIAAEMAPAAYDRSNLNAGPATVAGFAVAVWLTTLG